MALADYNMGSTGGGVSDLQAALNEVGAAISVDGSFGPETQSAVMRFQQARGLRPDGIAGPGTLIELATARGEGWTMPPVAPVPPGPITRPGALPGAKLGGVDTSMLVMLIGAGLLIWWWQSSNRRGSGFSGRSRPHPTDVAIEGEDEEEEPEEEESEGGEDEEDEDEEEDEEVD